MEFKDLDILDFGHKIMAAGIIYTDGTDDFALYFPNESPRQLSFYPLFPTVEEWEKLLKQTDDVLVQKQNPSTLTKAFVKKSQRNIDQTICWIVYARDGYRCRYCNRTGLPLTVDHIDLWENGGITTEANLLTACKQCNRNRGNLPYSDWLTSPKYLKVAVNLSEEQKQKNLDVIKTLPDLEKLRVGYKRTR